MYFLGRPQSDSDSGDSDHDDHDGDAQHVYFPECYPTDLYPCRASFPSLRQKKVFSGSKSVTAAPD